LVKLPGGLETGGDSGVARVLDGLLVTRQAYCSLQALLDAARVIRTGFSTTIRRRPMVKGVEPFVEAIL
jgi:hypothetical protein